MLRIISWQHFSHYGEVVGFVAAWAVAIVVALASQAPTEESRGPEGRKIVSNSAGAAIGIE
ncbi:MAG: hypothetical protein AAGF31_08640 [Planctomycetota bacterium]